MSGPSTTSCSSIVFTYIRDKFLQKKRSDFTTESDHSILTRQQHGRVSKYSSNTRNWTSVYSNTMKGAVLLLLVAVLVRLLLLWQRSHEWLGQRIEISTPINQWKRSALKLHVLVCSMSSQYIYHHRLSRDLHTHQFKLKNLHLWVLWAFMNFGSLTAVREGIALSEEGLSPYAGDIFHEVIMCYTP